MKARCSNPKNSSFSRYGAIGITVCERWQKSFEDFLEDMGPRPEQASIDRIDSAKGYTPDNCRWATRIQQNQNRSNVRRLEYNGKIQTIREWAKEVGLEYKTLSNRISRGWSAERALTLPLQEQFQPKTP